MTIKPPCFFPLATVAVSTLMLFALPGVTSRAASSFSLNDGSADPVSGAYSPGAAFTLAVTFTTTNASNGYSLWFDTATASAPRFSISQFTLAGGSPFNDANSANGAQAFNTANAGRPGFLSNLNDLGATPDAGPVAAGSYLVENVTFLIDAATPAGTYTLQTTPAEAGGRASGGVDENFSFENAPSAFYTVTVVPEPSTYVMLLLAAGVLSLVVWRCPMVHGRQPARR